MRDVKCVFCGSQTAMRHAYRHVTGWERAERQQGGTNALKLRVPSERYACYSCISERKHNRTEGQEAMW